ncbi:hypothetical protein RHMOL_Rhmol06G0136700 [Rhododendron molle]|uniref:Uncharacterized protein n=1 Tax=Rhododendron molle TaxID=49168 RepID=A0ACC0NC65_RHOML|nr:hypothetical protein RHMOL_Rhmol06G0136700 [Rhododendron molle]
MSDAWSDGKYRSITNFLVNSPRGTVFLKSINTSGIIKNADNLCDLFDDLVKEIGEAHVVQVVTDSASAYIQIRAMFASVKWSTSSYGKSEAAKKVESIILDDHTFWKAIKFCMKCVLPLVKVLRLVDGDSKPAMGFQYSETSKADREVRKGLYTTIERMYPDMDTKIIIDEQLEKFKNAEGMFGMDMAKLTRDKKQPVIELGGEEEEEEFDEATMVDDNDDDDDVEELDLEDD